jgi:hypothetical protein
MREVSLPGGGKIKIRESSKELPIDRFTDHQKYLMQDAGIGSKLGDVDQKYHRLDKFLQAGNIEYAIGERQNLHLNLYMMINKITIEHLSFVCLVESINGKRILDYSEENLKKVSKQLGELGLTQGMVADILEDVKKNSILN